MMVINYHEIIVFYIYYISILCASLLRSEAPQSALADFCNKYQCMTAVRSVIVPDLIPGRHEESLKLDLISSMGV
jgi:hypothetical protein